MSAIVIMSANTDNKIRVHNFCIKNNERKLVRNSYVTFLDYIRRGYTVFISLSVKHRLSCFAYNLVYLFFSFTIFLLDHRIDRLWFATVFPCVSINSTKMQ